MMLAYRLCIRSFRSEINETVARRMQERAAENWRLFDSMSIEWLPVEAEFTRCLLNKPIVRILPGIL